MAELNEHQVELIGAYIRQHGVASDALYDDLLDHVCTSIERLMDEGISFEAAFAKTIKLFGPGGLKQVQQQTFEILTEMNETMKKVAFVFGLTSAMLLLAGTVFKLLHWPGAGIMVVLGGGLLSLGYLPLLLIHKLKESPSRDALMHITGFVGMALTAIGVIFKVMHWPGAGVLLVGMATLGLFYVPIYFINKYKTSSNRPVTLSASLVAMTCLIMVFALINLNNSAEMDRAILLPGNHIYEEAKTVSEEDFRGTGSFGEAASTVVNLIDELSIEMIMESEEVGREQATRMNLLDLKRRNDHRTPLKYLFSDSDQRLDALVENLKLAKRASGEFAQDAMFAYEVDNSYELYNEQLNWLEYHFRNVPLTSVLSQFAQIKMDLFYSSQWIANHNSSQPAASGPPSGS